MKNKVLLVEDDTIVSELVSMALGTLDCQVVRVGDGIQAREALASNSFDLVIMDLYLPGIDGIKLLHWYRKELKSSTRVMILTAARIDLDQARAYGADDLMAKPIQLGPLIHNVEKLLKKDNPVVG